MKRGLLLLSLFFILFSKSADCQTVIVAGNDTTICLGGNANLTGTVVSGSYGTTSYTFEVIPYQPESFVGGTPVQFAANQDDQIAGPFDIGFDFCFFNQIYTQFYIGSNGWVGFSYETAWTTFTAQAIPTTNPVVPKNCIMAPWQDWWPGWTPAGTNGTNVYYYVTGTAPNRKLVVYWIHCPLYNCTGDVTKRGTFQIVMNEQNSIVENHIESKPNCSNSENATQGVHNIDGTVAFTAVGRNCTPWTTTNESTRFVPSGIRWYTGGYPGGNIVGYGENITVTPTTTTTYTVAVESCAGGTATDDVTVFVVDATFAYSSPTYCAMDPDPEPTLLQNGGSFSATPAGLNFISTTTGKISLLSSLPGTYLITRTITTPCTVSYSQSITIYPSPQVPVPVEDTVIRCDPGPVTMSVLSNPGEQYSWWDAPTGGNKVFLGPVMTINLAVTTTFYIEAKTIASSCTSTSRTPIIVIIKPIPHITNAGNLFSQCSGITTNILLTADQLGTVFTRTATPSSPNVTGFTSGTGSLIQETLVNTGYSIETVVYSVVPSLNGCDGPVVNITVTVYPVPDLSITPLVKGICQGQSTNTPLTSNVQGTLFTWTCTQTSGNVTGYSANPGPPSASINQVLNLTTFVPDSVIYHITPHANGCDGPVYDYKVLVNPVPSIITTPMYDTICSGMTTNIHLIATCAGTSFAWTATLGSGTVTGFADGTGDWILQTLLNPITAIGSVNYSITPSTSTCSGSPENFTVTVKPTPNMTNAPLNAAICNNTLFALGLTSDLPGSTFTWTCTPSSPNITGWANNGVPATMINQSLNTTGNNTEWVTYHLTPAMDGCDGPVTNYTVTVYPTTNLTNSPASQTQCNNLNANIALTSNVPGTLFTWTCTPSSANITGWANNGIPAGIISQVLDNTGVNIEGVTYQVTPTSNGCTGVPANYVVTVNPTPDLSNAPASKSQCNNLNTNILLTSNVPGTLFTWTCVPSSGNMTGWADNAVPTTTLNQTLNNTGFNIEWATYQVAPTANGCVGALTNYVVTVFPTPNVIFTPNGQTICSGSTTAVGLTSGVAGAAFAWTASGSGPTVSGFSPGSGGSISQVLTNAGPFTGNVTYQVDPTANGCPGIPNSVIVIVNPLPAVTVTSCIDPVVTTTSQPVGLKGAVPTGGTWSGPGVVAGIFFPGIAGPGNHLLTYSYTNNWGCVNTAGTSISVVVPAPFACGNAVIDLRDSQVYPTAQIGTQCWLAANLNYGNTIPAGLVQLDNCVREKYCFGDNPANCTATGGLYQWDEIMDYGVASATQGFCPPGWHIPSESDWNTLFSFYISNGFAGSPLKSTGFSGFNALLSGTRFNNVQWDFSNFAVMYWSSTAHGPRKAWAHGMNSFNPSVSFYPSLRNNAFPVRCILD